MITNTITNNAGDHIGYYGDIVLENKSLMKEAVDSNDYEQVLTIVEIQGLLKDYQDYNGLLVISENNGMGWTVCKYKDYGEKL